MKLILSGLAALTLLALPAQGQVLITQYYEGTSFNKWIELTNISASTVDLSIYSVALWSNANTEAYKTNGTPSSTLALAGNLGAGQSFLLAHASATLPSYATADVANSSVINFNGDDSFTLYTGVTFETANIVDAIGFTDAGSEGSDTSFYRLNTGIGWNSTAGSTVLDFPGVWGVATLTEVADAAPLTDQRLGYSAVPEPGTVALCGLGLAAMIYGIRRRRSA